jgi:hypothetical protein
MLNSPITRLETWVREDRVPHLRAGVTRGVEFTAEYIRQIGRDLPELMGGRRGRRASGSSGGRTGPAEQATSRAAGPQSGGRQWPPSVPAEPPVVDIAAWAQLRAHQPRPRST